MRHIVERSWVPALVLAMAVAVGCGECQQCGCSANESSGQDTDKPPSTTTGGDQAASSTELVYADSTEGEWGTIKGQVVWQGKDVPARSEIAVNVDQAHCLSKGKLYDEKWVINKENKGVRWVVVWLIPEGSGAVPVHPSLAKPTSSEVVLDQPCCQFMPRVTAMRAGQKLVSKNSSPVTHNVKWYGGKTNGEGNTTVPPAGEAKLGTMKVSPKDPYHTPPISLECNIHPWMKGWVRVFNHPYFAVTDANGKFEIKLAPAGKFRLVTWHEDAGWGPGGKHGNPITIKANGETDAGKIEIKPAD